MIYSFIKNNEQVFPIEKQVGIFPFGKSGSSASNDAKKRNLESGKQKVEKTKPPNLS